MEQYLDAKVKRFVQFSNRYGKDNFGIGWNSSRRIYETHHKRVILVDYNPVNSLVRRNSLVGEFDLVNSQPANYSPITFVDCDFCKSIVVCEDTSIIR